MKGAIFIAFNEMIESKMGIQTWEQLLTNVRPESGGVYISVDDYPDEELYAYVQELSNISGEPVSALVNAFGENLFGALNRKYPEFTAQQPSFFGFIESIDSTIHKEVEKLYSNPNLPKIVCERLSDRELWVLYSSPRKLCMLAEGLIAGAAKFYQVRYELEHDLCMHRGDEHCRFKLKILG